VRGVTHVDEATQGTEDQFWSSRIRRSCRKLVRQRCLEFQSAARPIADKFCSLYWSATEISLGHKETSV